MLLKAFYNEDWEAVDEGSPMSLFEVTVDLEGQVNAIGDLTLYDFSIQIRRLKPYFRGKDIQPILHSLNTKIYTETLEEAKLP
jgi:hypothetical protein